MFFCTSIPVEWTRFWLLIVCFWEEWKRSLAQEVCQKSDISERRSKSWRGLRPLQSLLSLQHVQLCHRATCQGLSYTKNEYSLFYQKFDAEYFFIQQFFRKKSCIFKETANNCFGSTFDNFLGKEGVLLQKLT